MAKKKINGNKLIIYGCIILGLMTGVSSVLGGYFGGNESDVPVPVNETVNKSAEQKKADSIQTVNKTENHEAKVQPVQVQKVEHNYSVLVKKSAFSLYLLDNGQVVKQYGVALGKNPGQKEKRGDMKTPTGTFRVDEIIDASAWTHDFGDGKGEIKGAYGPWFISLDTMQLSKGEWDGIGIHGTHDNASIGTRASEGCIRLRNEDVDELKRHVKVGTMVTIEE